jgi:magnesium transporter
MRGKPDEEPEPLYIVSSGQSEMITVYRKKPSDQELIKQDSLRSRSWINVEHADDNDIQRLTDITGLSEADIRDGLDNFEIPRIEKQDNFTLIFLRNPSEEIPTLHTSTITVIFSKDYFITLSANQNSIIDWMLESGYVITTDNQLHLLYLLISRLSREYTRMTRKIRASVMESRNNIDKKQDRYVTRLIQNEEVLNQYQAALSPIRLVMENILSGRYFKLQEEESELFEDLYNEIKQSEEITLINLKSIRSLRDSFQILFTNTLNERIETLTFFTIFMTIPTVIASIFGMNVNLPLMDHPQAFIIIIITIIIFLCSLLFYFRKKGWI